MAAQLSGLGFRRRLRAGSVVIHDRGIVYQNLAWLSDADTIPSRLVFYRCQWRIGVRSWRLAREKGSFLSRVAAAITLLNPL